MHTVTTALPNPSPKQSTALSPAPVLVADQPLETPSQIVRSEVRLTRYQLQATAQKLMPGTRLSSCMHRLQFGKDYAELVRYEAVDGKARYAWGGVTHCHDVWGCPVCSSQIARVRRQELRLALENARMLGYHVYLLTLTVRHSYTDNLTRIKSGFREARRELRQSRAWREIKADGDIVGSIHCLEITHGEAGWHVHSHEIVLSRQPFPDGAGMRIFNQWVAACKLAGLRPPSPKGFDFKAAHSDEAAKYVSKWGLAEEVSLQDCKTAHGNQTPWGLLTLARAGDRHAAKLFQEYAASMRGTQRIVFSKGLRAALLIMAETPDDQVDLEPAGVTVQVFDRYQWYAIVQARAHWLIIELCNAGELIDAEEVWRSAIAWCYGAGPPTG